MLSTDTFVTMNPVEPDPMIHGGKGAGLLAMAKAGFRVPEAMILSTATWAQYRQTGELDDAIVEQIMSFVSNYPASMFSVRSGAPISMPGMMDTVLNVGVTSKEDSIFPGAYERFCTSWLKIVQGVPASTVKDLVGRAKDRACGDPVRFRKLVHEVVQSTDHKIPDTRGEQILGCVKAVFDSWDTPRAQAYREMHGISDDIGTACVIQRMVMGTAEGVSGSGVMFSRDPATGEPVVRGEFALNAQGEEVVSGEITPMNLNELEAAGHTELLDNIRWVATKLEEQLGDVQDVEFTVESGVLYVLQTRLAKMSARARIRTACDLSATMPLSQQYAFLKDRITRSMVSACQVPTVAADHAEDALGLAASPGAIAGRVVTRDTPLTGIDKSCILVAEDTSPDDFPKMAAAGAILTMTGGFTCHAAVVARGIGVPAVVGCEGLAFSQSGDVFIGDQFVTANDPDGIITLDGSTGQVWFGEYPVKKAGLPRELYARLAQIVQQNGTGYDPSVWFYDSGLGDRVVLPLDPGDIQAVDRQIQRMHRLEADGREVAFCIELPGFTEGVFAPGDDCDWISVLAENYGPDLHGHVILYGLPSSLAPVVDAKLGMSINSKTVAVLDLLDLLEG